MCGQKRCPNASKRGGFVRRKELEFVHSSGASPRRRGSARSDEVINLSHELEQFEDALFMLLKGELAIELETRTLTLRPGELADDSKAM